MYEQMIEIPLWNKINADQDILIIKNKLKQYFLFKKFSLETRNLSTYKTCT